MFLNKMVLKDIFDDRDVIIFNIPTGMHYSDVTWAPWCLKSTVTRMFFNPLFMLSTNKTLKIRTTGPYEGKLFVYRMIPVMRKAFYIMTSSQ